jgi:hypothetical protein
MCSAWANHVKRRDSGLPIWEDVARAEADTAGITLHTTRHHDATKMDARLADSLIPLYV